MSTLPKMQKKLSNAEAYQSARGRAQSVLQAIASPPTGCDQGDTRVSISLGVEKPIERKCDSGSTDACKALVRAPYLLPRCGNILRFDLWDVTTMRRN